MVRPSEFGKLLLDGMLDLLFPPRCLICGEESASPFCDSCKNQINWITLPVCRKCGLPADASSSRCRNCRSYYSFDFARSAGWHEGNLRDAIHLLKYQGKKRLARPLAEILTEAPSTQNLVGEILIPVPLHPSRYRERGFNQSELVAREFGAIRDIPIDTNILLRSKMTPSQVGRTAQERIQSLQGAFSVKDPSQIKEKDIILLDDVFTTGGTASQAARTLHAAGAARVTVLTISRDK